MTCPPYRVKVENPLILGLSRIFLMIICLVTSFFVDLESLTFSGLFVFIVASVTCCVGTSYILIKIIGRHDENFSFNANVSKPALLQNLIRRLIPRHSRSEIDLIIRDLTLDLREMSEEGQTSWLIKTVKWWHTATTIYSLLCDFVRSALICLWPSIDCYSKISTALNIINKDDNEGQ